MRTAEVSTLDETSDTLRLRRYPILGLGASAATGAVGVALGCSVPVSSLTAGWHALGNRAHDQNWPLAAGPVSDAKYDV